MVKYGKWFGGCQMKNKVTAGIIIVIVAVLVLSIFIPIPIRIDKEIEAVEISIDDPNYCKPTTIKVKGELSFYLIGDNDFKGTITIEGYNDDDGNMPLNYVFNGNKAGGPITTGYMGDREIIGSFHVSTFLDKWVVQMNNNDKADGTSSMYYIAGPAFSREEAIKIFNSVSDTKWFGK